MVYFKDLEEIYFKGIFYFGGLRKIGEEIRKRIFEI